MSDTPLESNIAVNPGKIDDFARFLDEMQGEIAVLEKKVEALRVDNKADFGAYAGSSTADGRHLDSVDAMKNNLFSLSGRATELVEGTRVIAGRYRTVEDLNGAGTTDVKTALDEGAENVKEDI